MYLLVEFDDFILLVNDLIFIANMRLITWLTMIL